MFYIYGPVALIFILPSFGVRLGAAETMDVSHVRVNVGRGVHMLILFLQISLRGDFTHTHTHKSRSGLFELLTCPVGPAVKETR